MTLMLRASAAKAGAAARDSPMKISDASIRFTCDSFSNRPAGGASAATTKLTSDLSYNSRKISSLQNASEISEWLLTRRLRTCAPSDRNEPLLIVVLEPFTVGWQRLRFC